MSAHPDIAAIAIGRNEGPRLIACLDSLSGQVGQIIYVDSGSTDGSQAAAEARGAKVVALDMSVPFTAARARNAGLAAIEGDVRFVQLLDGDCSLQAGWLDTARAYLEANPKAAVACGRRRERFPEATLYNWLTDLEWDTPVGQARSCGGDALMRRDALDEVGGYDPSLIAGEEPEMCVRLRAAGWEVWRLDAEMTLHDADMTRFGQWWQRTKRAGHAYAEGAALHGAPPERHNVAQLRRAVLWGLVLPVSLLLAGLVFPWCWLLVLIYPLQVLRLHLKGLHLAQAFFFTIGKFAEAQGALLYHWRRRSGAKSELIEYK